FVEADMPVVADAEQLQVDAPAGCKRCIVLRALVLRPFGKSVRNMRIVSLDINMIEELFLHVISITLGMIRRQAEILIQVESGSMPVADQILLVQGNHLLIDADRRAAGGQSKHSMRIRLNCAGDESRRCRVQGLLTRERQDIHEPIPPFHHSLRYYRLLWAEKATNRRATRRCPAANHDHYSVATD